MKLHFLNIDILINIIKNNINNNKIDSFLEYLKSYDKFTIIPPEGVSSLYYLNKEELLNNRNLFLSIVFKKRIFFEDNELLEPNDIYPNLFIIQKDLYNWFIDKISKFNLLKEKINNNQIILESNLDLNFEEFFVKILTAFNEFIHNNNKEIFNKSMKTNYSNYFIGNSTIIGDNVEIYPFVYIGSNVYIGNNVKIYPNVSIYDNVYIGNNVVIHSNTTIGSDGFGYTDKLQKIYQIGGVVIKNNVEIGSNVSIDRATVGYTFISENTKIDNQVQIGHNVKIGRNCRIVSKVGIAGSARIYDNCILAAMSGIKDGIKIGPNTILAGNTMATKNLEPNKIYAGYPPKEFSQHFKDLAIIQKIIDSYKKEA